MITQIILFTLSPLTRYYIYYHFFFVFFLFVDMYQRLVKYKKEHGHCLVPRRYERDPKLSTWVETQRVLWNRDYRKKDPNEAVEAAAG
jgi:hypothetical protein